jgi:hypothetical protein
MGLLKLFGQVKDGSHVHHPVRRRMLCGRAQ